MIRQALFLLAVLAFGLWAAYEAATSVQEGLGRDLAKVEHAAR